jgi:PPM family protein phosphatase
LTSEQANLSVPKNVITRSLGPELELEVDLEGPLVVELGDVYVLCSDGLSGPVDDHEIGAIASNFHPRDACRYLVNLANLRGGLDNITVVIVRIGDWVDPDSTEVANKTNPNNDRPHDRRKAWGSRIADLLKGRSRAAKVPVGEEHHYRTAECPIDELLIERLDVLTRQIQEQAISQAWSLDWTAMATLRRQAAEARAAHNPWVSLRKIAEIIALLGVAARFFRKSAGPNPSIH